MKIFSSCCLFVFGGTAAVGCAYDFGAVEQPSGSDTISLTEMDTQDSASQTNRDSDSLTSKDTGSGSHTSQDTGSATTSTDDTHRDTSDTQSATGSASDTGPATQTDSETQTLQAPACEGVVCDSPSPNECSESGALVIWNSPGWCDQGECHYSSYEKNCPSTECVAGRCAESPCFGMTCASPPGPRCRDENTLIISQSNGWCEDASCDYAQFEVPCVTGCQSDMCLDNPCAGVVCRTPPARYCDGDQLIVYDTLGRCQSGARCAYGTQAVQCGLGGCVAGRCSDGHPCDYVTCDKPPARYCSDSSTLRAFAPVGTCESGVCSYETLEFTCAQGCENGACLGQPCAGVNCSEAPSSYCADEVTLVHWSGEPGVCDGGVCTYATVESPCPGECKDGACVDDPCVGVLCVRPPAAHCDGGTLVSYASLGACSFDGTCYYEELREECAAGCAGASCLPDTDSDSGTDNSTATDSGTTTSDTDTDSVSLNCADLSSLQPVTCPSSMTYGGLGYARCTTVASPRLTWEQADLYCRCTFDSRLAIVSNAGVQASLETLLGGGWAWIGASDVLAEGHWLWRDGTLALGGAYDNWSSGEPNNMTDVDPDGEDCAMMTPGWYDVSCDRTNVQYFVCERTPTEIIVDNTSAGFVASSNWKSSSSVQGYFGVDYLWRNSDKTSDDPAQWYADLPAGTYQVYARWTSASDRIPEAKYAIWSLSGYSLIIKDQSTNGGQWVLLGTWPMAAGYSKRVQLSRIYASGNTKVVIADAIRFVLVP